MLIPFAYQAGYEKARILNPQLAARYVEHTMIGDPPADAAVESLAAFGQDEIDRLIQAGMARDASGLGAAPQPLKVFFDQIEVAPSWFDPLGVRVYAGCRAFQNDSDLFLLAFIGDVIIRGFATLISKSFFMTGRIWDHGVRRLRRNILHLNEIMIPGGLERQGDGWKQSVRIRLVHAQVRRLLRISGEWDAATYGTPLSAAHVALTAASFSAQLLKAGMRLGARPDAAGRDGIMQIWRYTAFLLGVPEAVLFRGEGDAHELLRIGYLCEPPPDIEAIAMANGLINTAPLVANISDPVERRHFVRSAYGVSRKLIGHRLADQLRFPRRRAGGLLMWLRLKRNLERALGRPFPNRWGRARKFTTLLQMTSLESPDFGYRLPTLAASDQSEDW